MESHSPVTMLVKKSLGSEEVMRAISSGLGSRLFIIHWNLFTLSGVLTGSGRLVDAGNGK